MIGSSYYPGRCYFSSVRSKSLVMAALLETIVVPFLQRSVLHTVTYNFARKKLILLPPIGVSTPSSCPWSVYSPLPRLLGFKLDPPLSSISLHCDVPAEAF